MMENIRGLIIDSNCDMANFMEIVLGLAGFECQAVASPLQALEFLAARAPELVFLNLDGTSGDQAGDLLAYLHSEPRFDRTRVIALTGQPWLDRPGRSLADLVLPNPLESEHLARLTSRLMVIDVRPHAFCDPETGLYNLKFFTTRLELALQRLQRRPELNFALLALELDGQEATEPLSESQWEQVVKVVAGRWLAKFRPTNAFGRYARRHFVVLVEDLQKAQDVKGIIERLVGELSQPVELGGRQIQLAARIAGVVNPAAAAGAQEVLHQTILALENAGWGGEALLVPLGAEAVRPAPEGRPAYPTSASLRADSFLGFA